LSLEVYEKLIDVKSGLPATTSTEISEVLDDNEHILSIRIIGGDHRLRLGYEYLLTIIYLLNSHFKEPHVLIFYSHIALNLACD
jgi:hypothetical protein